MLLGLLFSLQSYSRPSNRHFQGREMLVRTGGVFESSGAFFQFPSVFQLRFYFLSWGHGLNWRFERRFSFDEDDEDIRVRISQKNIWTYDFWLESGGYLG